MTAIIGKIRCFKKTTAQLGRRTLQVSSRLCEFWEPDDKGGYKNTQPYPNFKERMRLGLQELKSEIKLWTDEVKETFDWDPLLAYRPGEVDVVWRFNKKDSLKQWLVTSDKDHNEGYSECSLQLTNYGKGLFSGTLSTKLPKDGKIKRAGYCNIKTMRARKSFKRTTYLDWSAYNMLVMKVRGDGRSYLLNIHTRGYWDITWNDMYHFALYTRGGPYWQIVRIPFSRFFLSSKGRIQDRQTSIPLEKITSFGITAGEKHNGSFSLEIDYIGLEFDPNNQEEFAYEMYKTSKNIAAT
ncbi:complex I intermediate-associated protein 30, mitochondrial [Cylas formicarius]|uniref:complex I intermediate-associated protein 30, mitochondrial n=1 Tax=Cylas formicarius TaxID=197179 RepID=UPI00295893B8|nr:complex I intermediate-associated protein 30, mitochondrial [Cylas formicarius]